MNEVDKAALRERFSGMSEQERAFELAVMIHDSCAAHEKCRAVLFGNGRRGHIHRIYLWLCALSVGLLVVMGKNGISLIGRIAKLMKEYL